MRKASFLVVPVLLAVTFACESKQEAPPASERRENNPLVREQLSGLTKTVDVRVTRIEGHKLEGEQKVGDETQSVEFILTPQTERTGDITPDSWVKVFYQELGQSPPRRVALRVIVYGGSPP